MIRFFSLSSGSCGNCYYFTNGEVSFLIDAGVGPRITRKNLLEHELKLEDVDFILVTHDHIDHIKSLGIISSKYSKPVYTTKGIRDALLWNMCTRGRLKGSLHLLEKDKVNNILSVKVTPFDVPHDATETVGYFIEFEGHKITIITDCGYMTPSVLEYACLSDTLILESNYDSDMLKEGNYPYQLKTRILGESGHLSNAEACEALMKIYSTRRGRLDNIFLCHISGNNNTPERCYNAALEALESVGARPQDMLLAVLPRGVPSKMYSL